MTFETGVAVLACILMPILLYIVMRTAQYAHNLDKYWTLTWNIQQQQNETLTETISQYMPQGVTLQQIKSELTDHLQQHAARDMRQTGSLNTAEYPNLRGPISPPLESDQCT